MSNQPSERAMKLEKAIRGWLEGDSETPTMAHVIDRSAGIAELEAKAAFMNECDLATFKNEQRLLRQRAEFRKRGERAEAKLAAVRTYIEGRDLVGVSAEGFAGAILALLDGEPKR